jgi:hypothetical protein
VTAARTTTLAGCRQCAGRPARVLETVSGGRHDNNVIAEKRAGELGDGAHTHADITSDMHIVRAYTPETAS